MKRLKFFEVTDKRVTKRKTFFKEFAIILCVMLVTCSGALLMFDMLLDRNSNPWFMALTISSYMFFMGFIVSVAMIYIVYSGFNKPLHEIGQAAKKVAEGDFSVKIKPRRTDGKMDEMEVFIEDFNKMVKELETIETLKGDFISNISHEFKTPLAIIQSYAIALRKENLTHEEKDDYIETIVGASKKLSELVSSVLRMNKLDSQEIILNEPFSLDEQLRLCILALDEKLDDKNLKVNIELEEVIINSDPSLLEIVWNNLLTNALKFTEKGGAISIVLRKEPGKAIVIISDTGCGMDYETQKRIFDRFYQGDTSHTTEGNGLGLALVRRVIDLVNGEISVTSVKGNGSTFTVVLKTNLS